MLRSPLQPVLRSPLSNPLNRVRRGGTASFDPATLFGASDRGGIYDLTDSSLLFQSSAGSTAVGELDPIGYASDLGPLTKPALQSTAASRPLWAGAPRTLGDELVTNGTFSADSDWTKGSGWTISGGVATKTAGTASVLSQAISLTAGKMYFVTYQITRTAGAVTARFTGGTTVAGSARSYRGSWVDQLVAVTGNTTLEFSADATFAGSVTNVTAREVTSFVNRGALFDRVDDFLQTASMDLSNNDKCTIVVSFQNQQNALASTPAEFGNYNASLTGSLQLLQNAGWFARGRGATGGPVVNNSSAAESAVIATNASQVMSATLDLSGSGIAGQVDMRLRGTDPALTTSGAVSGGGAMANSSFTIGRAFTSAFRWQGLVHRAFVINRILTSEELQQVEAWAKSGMAYCAQIGDSTVALINTSDALPQAMPIHSMVGGMVCGAANVSDPGDRIADQKTAWSALANKDALQAVFIQIGLNDVKGRVGEGTATTAQVIADLQDLVDTVNADKPSGCKVYISGLTPCKAWLDAASNPADAYSAWLAVNEAIAGGGATPIAGVDGRITSHVAALNDGSGNLAPQYDMDGVHENNAARFVIAQAWRAQLEADRLV